MSTQYQWGLLQSEVSLIQERWLPSVNQKKQMPIVEKWTSNHKWKSERVL